MKTLTLCSIANPFDRLKQQLDLIEVTDATVAKWICLLIPDRCPFERKIYWFGYLVCYIPPLCKLNPFYKQLLMLRLKALTCLSEYQND